MTSLPETRQDATELTETGRAETDLGGLWQAAEANEDLRRSFPRPDLDDSGWQPLVVPGHWRSEPAFASTDGPLFYRKRFEMDGLEPGQRAWLTMDGIFYQSDVWLDGSYLGDTEGYFFPHTFDITSALEARSEHVLALEVVCDRPARRAAKRALMGVFGYWDCIDPAYNPGGIWAPVRVGGERAGRICPHLRVTCVSADAQERRPRVVCRARQRRSGHGHVAHAKPAVPAPSMARRRCPRREWRRDSPWPSEPTGCAGGWRSMNPTCGGRSGWGARPCYDISVTVELEGERACSKVLRTGLRAGAGCKTSSGPSTGNGFS